jgi:hypothetical protein
MLLFFTNLQLAQTLQAQNVDNDSIYSDTIVEEFTSYFSFDLSFTNNNLANSNVQSLTSAATMADISFYHKSGFWATLFPVFYHNAEEVSYDLDALLGYQYFFNSGFDINAYYSHHTYVGDSLFRGINYQHSFTLSVGYEFKGLYTYIDGYSLLGDTENYFLDAGVGYYKEFSVGKRRQSYLILFPLISITSGTDAWIYDDLLPSEKYSTAIELKSNGYDWNSFDIQSIDLMLPISYSQGNFTVSLSYLFSVPTNKYKLLGWENQSGIMLSVNYLLNLKK